MITRIRQVLSQCVVYLTDGTQPSFAPTNQRHRVCESSETFRVRVRSRSQCENIVMTCARMCSGELREHARYNRHLLAELTVEPVERISPNQTQNRFPPASPLEQRGQCRCASSNCTPGVRNDISAKLGGASAAFMPDDSATSRPAVLASDRVPVHRRLNVRRSPFLVQRRAQCSNALHRISAMPASDTPYSAGATACKSVARQV